VAIVTNGSKIKLHMTETLKDGKMLGSTSEGEPVAITVGQEETFDELHKALIGMSEGQTKKVHVPCDKAYGPYRESLVFNMKKENIPDDINAEPGKKLMASFKSGKSREVTVLHADENKVTLDANHPLAGKDLVFELKVVEISEQ
jgi:FKBP-type peptidyl-prolyl cis-trans isomerase 2